MTPRVLVSACLLGATCRYDGKCAEVEAVRRFDLGDAAHYVLVIRKRCPTPAAYPRRYSKIKQSPL